MQRTRVILADDHKLLLDAVKNLLEPEFQVVGTFGDGHTLVEEAPALSRMSLCSTWVCQL